ncbi:hypothetical protein FJZ17_00250 [Candidatus Pacearchaeota archaeon]|nr:hypothetical protein [Candidatus Pacearchaeota archaeon]
MLGGQSLSKMIIKRVPYFKQKKEYTCGPASLKMVFKFLGKKYSENKLTKEARTSKKTGTSHGDLIKVVSKHGFFSYVQENSTLEQLKYFIDKKFPIIINYIEPCSNEGHYAVVVGYNKRGFSLNDPWNGKNFFISNSVLLRRWKDKEEKFDSNRWLLVLSKSKFRVGKQYLPIKK